MANEQLATVDDPQIDRDALGLANNAVADTKCDAPEGIEVALEILSEVIADLNESEFADKQLSNTPDTPLFGKAGTLDSLDLVNLVLATEDAIEDRVGERVSLADDRAMSQKRSPFRTVGSLAEYITLLLSEKTDG